MSRLAHKAWQTCVGVNSEKYLGIEVTGVYILRMHSRLIACIVGCLFAISTVVCANAIFNDDAALANTLANVPPSGSKPVTIPNDVAVGMLIYKVDPEYPAKAKAGEISDLHPECGPAILQEPSLKAVREWKYRPYLLRGEPVEVQTTIRVTFALGGKKKLPFSKDSCPVE